MENFSISNILKTCGVTKDGDGFGEIISRIAQPAITNQLLALADNVKLLPEITNKLIKSPKLSPIKDTHILYAEETIRRLRIMAMQPNNDSDTSFSTPARSSSEEFLPIDLSQYEVITNGQKTPITRIDRSPMTNSCKSSWGAGYKLSTGSNRRPTFGTRYKASKGKGYESPTGSVYRTPMGSSYESPRADIERSLKENAYYSPTTKLLKTNKTPVYF